MSDSPDAELLEQFARNQSEAAFAELVERHLGLVYSTAFRKTENPQHAEDIAQAVFIILARKARSLGSKTVLLGWLYNTARLTAANFQRAEWRRIRREQEAFMQSTVNEPATDALWRELSPLLEDAMAGLGTSDRDAIVLRFFQNRSMAEVGAALGASEDSARMRVNRALEKLRKFFIKRGSVSTTVAIAGLISSNSVQAAPAGLAQNISAVALAKGAAASTSTVSLVKGALKVMAWTKAKTAMVAGAVILLAAGTATIPIYVHQAHGRPFNPGDFWATSYPTPDINAGTHGDNLDNTTFPAGPVQLCSISGLLDQCMDLTGWQYLIDKGVSAGTVEFGHPKPLNGEEWVAAFEHALENDKPEWWDQKTKKLHRENLVLIRYPDQKIVLVLPPEKAAQYQNPSAESTAALAKKLEPDTSAVSPETAFLRESTNHLNLAKQWGMICRIFAQEHNNRLPDNMDQLKSYASGLPDTDWELVSGGSLDRIRNRGATIMLREKEPRQGPDGTFVKAYTFADGRARLETSPDKDFTALERQRGFLVHPAGN